MQYIESQTVECKREYVDDIKKTVIAFANTSGGRIYIGIGDNGEIIGVSNVDDVMLKASNSIRDSIRPDVTMFVSYHIDKIDDKNIIVIEVQKGTACPYYLENKGIKPSGVYVRQGASSVPTTEAAILRMIKETDGDQYENIRCMNQELTFEYAESEFQRADIAFGEPQKKSLHLVNEDDMYTNLAQLLSDQCSHSIKIAVFDGTEKTNFRDRAEFTGSVLKQVNDAYTYINQYNRTRSEFQDIHRIDIRDYPTEAIREALLNAVVHRDYAFSGSILISIFDDRIEFISIGGLVKGISYQDMMLGVSIQRNENLANIFYRLNLIEAFGTGIPKIMRSYTEISCKPEVTVTDNAFKIALPNKNTNSVTSSKVQSHEDKIMQLLKKQKSITRRDVETLLSLSQASAARILHVMVENGKLSKVGSGKTLKYEISPTN